jgi:hypothetical protein
MLLKIQVLWVSTLCQWGQQHSVTSQKTWILKNPSFKSPGWFISMFRKAGHVTSTFCKLFVTQSSSSSIGSRWLVPPEVLQPCRLIVRARLWKSSLAPPGASTPTTWETSSREKGNYGREMTSNFADKWQVPCHLKGSFTCRKSVTWDRQLYFLSEGRHAEDFFIFILKNPTALAGFEPANLGTRGQHDTPRPPKPLTQSYSGIFYCC